MLQSTIRYVIVRGLLSAVGIATLILTVRLLGPSETGKMALVVGLISILGPLPAFGTDSALARFVVGARRQETIALYARAFRVVGVGAVLLVAAIGALAQLNLLPQEVRSIVPLVVAVGLTYSVVLVHVYMLRGLGRLNLSSVVEGTVEIGPRVLVIPLLLLLTPSYVLYVKAQWVAVTACLLLSVWAVRQSLPAETAALPAREAPRGYRVYASQAWIAALLALVFVNTSIWILRYYRTPDEVGLFSVAQRLPNLLGAVLLAPLMTPLLYHYTADESLQKRSHTLLQGITLLSGGMGAVSLVLAGLSGFIARGVFGPAFSAAAPAFRLYAFVLFLAAPHPVLQSLMFSQNRVHVLNLMTAIQLLVLGALGVALTPRYGIVGATGAVLATYVVGNLLLAWRIRDVLPGLRQLLARLYIRLLPFAMLAATPGALLAP